MDRSPIGPKAEFLSLCLALVLVLGIIVTSYRTWNVYRDQSEQVALAEDIIADSNALMSSLKDAETGQRGFLLTGEDQYLDPYRRAVVELPTILVDLRRATAARADQVQRISKLSPMVKDKLDELKQTIDLRQHNDVQGALAVVMSQRGKIVMDDLRQACITIQAVARDHLTRYANQSKAAADQLGLIATLGSIVLFVLLAISTLTISKGTRRRQLLIWDLQKSEAQNP